MYMLCKKNILFEFAGSSVLEENMASSSLAMSCTNNGYVLYI